MSHKVERVLYNCVYGSNLYGTQLPSSDKDYKAVYLPTLSSLLLGKTPQTFRDSTAQHGTKHGADDVETEYVPVQTWAADVPKGQTYALELLFAFRAPEVEQSTSDVALMVRFTNDLKNYYLSNTVKPMVGYALNMARQYGVRGQRLTAIEQLDNELHSFVTAHPHVVGTARLSSVMPFVSTNKYVTWVPVQGYGFQALQVMDKQYYETMPLADFLPLVHAMKEQYGHRVKQAQKDGFVDWKATYHAVRVMFEANEFLSTGQVVLPLRRVQREYLLAVRQGNVALEDVKAVMEDELNLLDSNEKSTLLQPWDDQRERHFTNWLEQWMMKFYKL